MGYYVIKKSQPNTGLSMARTLLGSMGQYYFVLKASNGEVIATSEMYNSKQAAENGIRSVQSNGSSTEIHDET
ncbi:YegP family protein [uncultured Pantoea sp.]|uniref:YegP family protein n=1 Tax=uncultured Pantoea sp. TaxID=218084 RepID=UPI0025E5DDFD|nr:YegP family protein [uncultured Pantoea sp.]